MIFSIWTGSKLSKMSIDAYFAYFGQASDFLKWQKPDRKETVFDKAWKYWNCIILENGQHLGNASLWLVELEAEKGSDRSREKLPRLLCLMALVLPGYINNQFWFSDIKRTLLYKLKIILKIIVAKWTSFYAVEIIFINELWLGKYEDVKYHI